MIGRGVPFLPQIKNSQWVLLCPSQGKYKSKEGHCATLIFFPLWKGVFLGSNWWIAAITGSCVLQLNFNSYVHQSFSPFYNIMDTHSSDYCAFCPCDVMWCVSVSLCVREREREKWGFFIGNGKQDRRKSPPLSLPLCLHYEVNRASAVLFARPTTQILNLLSFIQKKPKQCERECNNLRNKDKCVCVHMCARVCVCVY